MLGKMLLSASLLLSISFCGCADDELPPQSPNHSVSITEAQIVHRAVLVDANFTGPAYSEATIGLYHDRLGILDRKTIEFDENGRANAGLYYETRLLGITPGTVFTVGITSDDGEHISTDSAAATDD